MSCWFFADGNQFNLGYFELFDIAT